MRNKPPGVDELLELVGSVYASALDPAKRSGQPEGWLCRN